MSDVVLGVFLSLVATWCATEIGAYFPNLLKAIINVAVRRLPPSKRDRFREEWSSHVVDTPGAVMKLWAAGGFIFASFQMFPEYRAKVRGISRRRKKIDQMLLAFHIYEIRIMLKFNLFYAALFVGRIVRLRRPQSIDEAADQFWAMGSGDR